MALWILKKIIEQKLITFYKHSEHSYRLTTRIYTVTYSIIFSLLNVQDHQEICRSFLVNNLVYFTVFFSSPVHVTLKKFCNFCSFSAPVQCFHITQIFSFQSLYWETLTPTAPMFLSGERQVSGIWQTYTQSLLAL